MSQSGKVAFMKRLRKSVMGRLRPLTPDERVDFAQLTAQGIPQAEARAIAQGYAAIAKADDGLSDAYLRAYHRAAKARLPQWQHASLHKAARGHAGARGQQDSRARKDEGKRALIEELDALKARIKDVQEEIGKSGPLSSQVHVDAPLDKILVAKRAGTFAPSAQELAYIQAAYDLQAPALPRTIDDGEVSRSVAPLMQANRLIQGMDAEMMGGAPNAEEARRRASRALKERPELFAHVGVPSQVRQMHGLMLDLGSGTNRAPGHLGLDIYAYDHGTVLHDVEMGLPFPDGSARVIRLHHALHEILDAPGANPSPVPLLLECQRVLMEGGILQYAGPEPLIEPGQDWPLPGLVLLENGGQPVGTAQVLKRVPLRVPAFHGADATFAPALPMPLDVQMALAAYNTAPADVAMANLVHKSAGRVVPIAKADAMRQIVTGVVLSPNELDTQDDYMTPEDIEMAAHNYLKQSRVIGSEHGRPIEAGVVESYIAPQDLTFDGPEGPTHVKKGSWLMSVHVADKQEWQQLMSGEYTGFSVGGLGTRLEAA